MTTTPEQLCELANKMNTERAQRGIRERYEVKVTEGVLSLSTYQIPPNLSRYTQSETMRPPQGRLA